jgi:hypothetical protein
MTEEEAEQEIKEALKPLIGKPVEEFQKLANEIIDNIKDKKIYDFKVECDITEPTLQDKILEKYLEFFCPNHEEEEIREVIMNLDVSKSVRESLDHWAQFEKLEDKE